MYPDWAFIVRFAANPISRDLLLNGRTASRDAVFVCRSLMTVGRKQCITRSDAVRIGSYGIEEPIEDYSVEPEVILVPCVGVTREGYRLGNGGGYFDRWLAERNPVTVAVAYEALVTEDFAPEEFDIPLDWILTESGIRRAGTKTDRSPKDAVRLL